MSNKTIWYLILIISVTFFMVWIDLYHENNKKILTGDVTFDIVIPEMGEPLVQLDSDRNLSLPYSELNAASVHDILIKHNFSNWSYEEQLALTNMMALTVRGIPFDDKFMDDIDKLNNSSSIFNAYVDLLENAGYK